METSDDWSINDFLIKQYTTCITNTIYINKKKRGETLTFNLLGHENESGFMESSQSFPSLLLHRYIIHLYSHRPPQPNKE